MKLMTEYTGQLIGGPEDGNPVTVSRPSIAVNSNVRLWLNGEDEKADITIIESKGEYTWNSEHKCFIWRQTSVRTYTQKVEDV